jgi:hypothetical protein
MDVHLIHFSNVNRGICLTDREQMVFDPDHVLSDHGVASQHLPYIRGRSVLLFDV